MAMEMHSVASSNVQAVGHDPDTNILRVVFKGGATYEYDSVPPIVAEGCWALSSAGKYLNAVVKKGGYPFRRIG